MPDINPNIRVSSIRRIYRPGLYRMELGIGDLGFDVEVSEAAIKRVPDEIEEPEIPGEEVPTPEDIVEAKKRFWEEGWPEAMESAGMMYTEPPVVSGKWTAPAPGPPTIPGLNNYLVTFPDGKKVIVAAKSTAAAYTVAKVPLWQMGLVTVKKI